MNQTLARITLPEGKKLYASRFRELLAKQDLPPAFFHRAADGHSLEEQPTIRVVGGKSWVGIVGDGENGERLINTALGPAIRAVSQAVDSCVPVRLETHLPVIETSEYPCRYWVREMVIKRRTKARRETPNEDIAAYEIMRGLNNGAKRFNLDVSLLSSDLVFRVESVHRPRGLRISTTSGDTDEYATLMDVEFILNRKLTGFWFAGALTSRGYGRIGRKLDDLVNGPEKARGTIK